MSDLLIQWDVPPAAVSKWFQKPRASWIDEVQAREDEAERHQEQIKVREAHEKARKQCPDVISQFQPIRNGRIDYGLQHEVTSALQAYLDKQEAQHQADLERFEADKTFTAWSVNWAGPEGVLAKMRVFADKAYDRGREGVASAYSTHVPGERL